MRTKITQIGNSRGIRLKSQWLEQCNFQEEVDVELIDNTFIVIKPIIPSPRACWDEMLKKNVKSGADDLIIGDQEYLSDADFEWEW